MSNHKDTFRKQNRLLVSTLHVQFLCWSMCYQQKDPREYSFLHLHTNLFFHRRMWNLKYYCFHFLLLFQQKLQMDI